MSTPFKMKGFSGFGNESPMKQDRSISTSDADEDNFDFHKESEDAQNRKLKIDIAANNARLKIEKNPNKYNPSGITIPGGGDPAGIGGEGIQNKDGTWQTGGVYNKGKLTPTQSVIELEKD